MCVCIFNPARNDRFSDVLPRVARVDKRTCFRLSSINRLHFVRFYIFTTRLLSTTWLYMYVLFPIINTFLYFAFDTKNLTLSCTDSLNAVLCFMSHDTGNEIYDYFYVVCLMRSFFKPPCSCWICRHHISLVFVTTSHHCYAILRCCNVLPIINVQRPRVD